MQSVCRLGVRGVLWLGVVCLPLTFCLAQQNPDGRVPLGNLGNPLILLLRDDAVLQELKVTPEQRDSLATLATEIDGLVWPARNQPTETSQKAWQTATELAQTRAAEILTAAQRLRVEQVILWIQGTRALTRTDIADAVQLKETQQTAIQKAIDDTNESVQQLQQQSQAGEPVKALEERVRKLQRDEQRQILKVLTPAQKESWLKLVGPAVDTSRLGKITFVAPALIASDDVWLNPQHAGTTLERRVTAVHFFANGCINCQRNYPHYKGWQQDFMPKGLQIVGIHTPETTAERDVELLRKRATEAGFDFPILVDNQSANWNAWGNSMWPSVYLVDHQQRIRYWWYGELNWQGATGEQQLRRRIEELLAEQAKAGRP